MSVAEHLPEIQTPVTPAPKTLGDQFNAKFNNFDFLRFFFAVAVVVSHGFILWSGRPDTEPLYRLSRGHALLGAWAVNGFFAISGFLITRSREYDTSNESFASKRIRRIYPGYIACFLICILVVGPLGAPSAAAYFRHFHPLRAVDQFLTPWASDVTLNNLGAFVNAPQGTHIDGCLWTLPYELACYIMLAVVATLGWIRNRRNILASAVAFYGIYALCCFTGKGFPFFGGLDNGMRMTTYFILGSAVYLYRDRIVISKWIAVLCVALICVTLKHSLIGATLPLCLTYLVFYTATLKRLPLQKWGRNGDFSYGIYLYNWPIMQLIVRYFPIVTSCMLITYSFVAALICGISSWNLVEKRFLKREQKPLHHTAA